jgi:hypothetical protein
VSTAAVTQAPWEKYQAPPAAAAGPWQKYGTTTTAAPSITPAEKEEPGILDRPIPLDSYTHATESGLQSIGRGVRDSIRGIGQTLGHPIDTAKGIASIPSQAAQIPAAIHDINQAPDPTGEYLHVAQDTAGQGAGQALTALGTEGLVRGIPKVASAAKPIVRAGLKTASDIVDPDITGMASPRLAHAQKFAGRLAEKLADKPVYPGAPLPEGVYPPTNVMHGPEAPEPITNVMHGPETPTPEVLQARGLQLGGRAIEDPSAGLSRIPVRTPAAAVEPAPALARPAEIPPPAEAAPSSATEAFSAGPRPVIQRGPIPGSAEDLAETRSIQDQIRDAAEREERTINSQNKREWFGRNQAGTPKSELTGAAEKPVRYTSTPGIRGLRVPEANEDLTPILQQSLDQARAAKGIRGVSTTAKPADLMQRWGVDPESLAEGREQTRGMSPKETEAAVNELAKAYKAGKAIDPVIETRDADNNLVDVDGRGRAIAAHQAGIDRIPVIVRRMGAGQ